MRLNRTRMGGALIAATAIMFAGAEQASAQVNMTGSWALEVTSDLDGAVTMPELTLEQDGMKLTGQYTSAALGENDVVAAVLVMMIVYLIQILVLPFWCLQFLYM